MDVAMAIVPIAASSTITTLLSRLALWPLAAPIMELFLWMAIRQGSWTNAPPSYLALRALVLAVVARGALPLPQTVGPLPQVGLHLAELYRR